MKKILFILALFSCLFANAQTDTSKYYHSFDYGWRQNRAKYLNALTVPSDTSVNKVPGSIAVIGDDFYARGIYGWIKWGTGNGGSGSVTNIATGYGLLGGPITSTGSIKLDSLLALTRAEGKHWARFNKDRHRCTYVSGCNQLRCHNYKQCYNRRY
jgi:hypothetical protein